MAAWLRNNEYARWILAVVRIWVGVQWTEAAVEKVGSPVWTGAQAGVAVSRFLQHALALTGGPHPSVQGWYGAFIRDVALPHAKVFSYLVSYGELLVGIGLVLGCLTTAAAVAGAVMNLCYLLAGTTSTNPILLVLEMIIAFAGFNAAYVGMDHWVIPYLRRRLGRGAGPQAGGPAAGTRRHKLTA
ncbi:MAG: DoxX family membrane protein [Alicyclobacillaceae bacterium]|nr:DoxX family membrane protein [Alicyclobacillaceae bacterium]